MRIVLITPGTGSYYCGVCMRDNALAKELIRQGHDAVMLPMYLPLTLEEGAASPESPIFFGGVNVYLQQKLALFRHTPRWLDRLLNARGLLNLAARQTGMTATAEVGELTFSMLRGEEGNQAKELDKLIDWLREHRPDAVWLSTALLAGLARRLRRELGVAVICSLQGEDVFLDGLPEPWRARSWETLAERSRDVGRFIAPSRFYAELMQRRMRLPEAQVRVIPNGIDLADFAEIGGAPIVPAIGFLARMIEGKGLGLVIDAFILLKKRATFSGVKLRVAGAMTAEDERYVATMRRKLAEAGCAGDAEFLPNVSREEKVAFLQRLTLLSVPTSYGEAFGLFLIEALAAGVPVVQPETASFPEIIAATGGGILFEPGSATALADAWESLLNDPQKAREFGKRGRAAVGREYSMPRLAARFLAATCEIMDAENAAP